MPTATVYFTNIRALYLNNGVSQGIDSFQAGEDNTFNETFRTILTPDFASAGIPIHSVFNTVTFTLTLEQAGSFRASNNRTLRFFRMLRSYTTSATWNTYDGSNNWNDPGADGATDRESSDVGNGSCLTSWLDESAHSFTLTAAEIQELFDGTLTNNGLILQMDTENADRFFFHRDTVGKVPYMTIDYTPPTLNLLIQSPGIIPVP